MVFELLKKVGKTPLKMSKEAVGFVANRLQAAMFREALSMALPGWNLTSTNESRHLRPTPLTFRTVGALEWRLAPREGSLTAFDWCLNFSCRRRSLHSKNPAKPG